MTTGIMVMDHQKLQANLSLILVCDVLGQMSQARQLSQHHRQQPISALKLFLRLQGHCQRNYLSNSVACWLPVCCWQHRWLLLWLSSSLSSSLRHCRVRVALQTESATQHSLLPSLHVKSAQLALSQTKPARPAALQSTSTCFGAQFLPGESSLCVLVTASHTCILLCAMPVWIEPVHKTKTFCTWHLEPAAFCLEALSHD